MRTSDQARIPSTVKSVLDLVVLAPLIFVSSFTSPPPGLIMVPSYV